MILNDAYSPPVNVMRKYSVVSFTLNPQVPLYSDGIVIKSCLSLVTPWTIVHQVPLYMGFSSQEYWSRLPFLSPGDLSDSGIKNGFSCIGRWILYH